MEIRYIVNAIGHSIISLDQDGDGTADGFVLALDTSELSIGDFLL